MSVYDVCVCGGAGYLPQWAHGGQKHTIKLANKSPRGRETSHTTDTVVT